MNYKDIEKSFKEYLYQHEYSKKTISSILEGTKDFLNLYSKVTQNNLLKYKESLINRRYSHSTINLRIYAVNKFSKFLAERNLPKNEKYIEYPKIKSVTIEKKTTLDNVISLDDYNKLKNSFLESNNMEMYFGIKMAAAAGLRPSEINMITNEGLLSGIQDIKSKRNKTRTVYFINSLSNEYKEYLKSLNKEINLNEKVIKISQKNFSYLMKKKLKN